MNEHCNFCSRKRKQFVLLHICEGRKSLFSGCYHFNHHIMWSTISKKLNPAGMSALSPFGR